MGYDQPIPVAFVMEELGARIDVSMASGINFNKKLVRSESTSGRLPDYTNTPFEPFRPSRKDATTCGGDSFNVWEAPVTSGIVGKNRDGSDKIEKLLMGTNPERIDAILDQILSRDRPYIVAESRSDVRTHPKTRARFDWVVDRYKEVTKIRQLEFLRFDQLADQLDAGEVQTAA